jgi:general secretion pathway protein A
MYHEYWGLAFSPFASGRRGGVFRSGSHTEGIARLQYLVQSSLRLGIVTGDEGVGKSTLMIDFAREIRRSGFFSCYLSVLGATGDEFSRTFLRKLGGLPVPDDTGFWNWNLVEDRLAVASFQSQGVVLLFDDVDQASRDVQQALVRILHWTQIAARPLTVVLGVNAQNLGTLFPLIANRCDLRIVHEPWTVDETAIYIKESLAAAGRNTTLFDMRALESIHQHAAGVPRIVCRLAELSLIAGAAEQLRVIDAEAVRDAFFELQIPDNVLEVR